MCVTITSNAAQNAATPTRRFPGILNRSNIMKRNNTVVNARAYRAGRKLAAWAASGMNWGANEWRSELMAQARVIQRSPALAVALKQGHDQLLDYVNQEATQSSVSAVVLAIGGDHTMRIEMMRTADDYINPHIVSTEYVETGHYDGSTRTVENYSDGSSYNRGYRAGGTWVDGWWN
jgi:hypothetical protein